MTKPRRQGRCLTVLGIILAMTVLLGACSPLGGEDAEAAANKLVNEIPVPSDTAVQADDTFVGLTENGIGVGLVIRDDAAVAYICDGNQLGHWLKGDPDGDRIDLRHAAGSRLEAVKSGDTVSGTVTLANGDRLGFSAAPVGDGSGGFFRTDELAEGFVYGWVVIPGADGRVSVRGVGVNSKSKSIDGAINVDDLDPGDASSPPVEDVSTDSAASGHPALDLSCEQIKANYDAHLFAADNVTSKALRQAYLQAAFQFQEAGEVKGCSVFR